MNCFNQFKDRSKTRLQKSAPTLKSQSKFDVSESERATSSCSATPPRRITEIYEEKAQNLRVFTFAELKQATNNFNRLLKIGEGGFGCVYKGTIKPPEGKDGDPMIVAIKKLSKDGCQGHKQWVAEVQLLGVVDHPNLVKLIGYCAVDAERGIQRLLVYEYMPKKSLEEHIFNRAGSTLSWERRLQIILGAAEGLAYLHEELEIQVIYRDFKSSNILLDGEFKAKLSDFGLAREGPTAGHTHVSTAVVGTYGYAAPDYIETGHLTSKSDVWSFGVVVYEMLTGRRSLERELPKPEQKLLEWVKQNHADSRRFSTIIDPRLENNYPLSAARKVAKLADSCLVRSGKDRPKMSKVVEALKDIIAEAAACVESPPMKYLEDVEDSPAPAEQMAASIKRRFAHLAKISENLDGVNTRRFMMMQRAKVT
ncbi:probable serine/threonine-protein kinase PBL19 [Salvia hispanica]|uniref:probable serine/threonine-protein kinase PBL19 n=1 Tax=Salvia hispanica TaxID=49212 RepID=UPI002008FAA5|nr:probable serine/threonine-protein kinase PBL19 [Salvia hispanica]XP_047979509.1 probable serine/threonine-protein kinase PBL19 [Salvia hispanica]XP_047979516.1 probable serine/threonine-protein kinase PBL19 [Salvia hispanica]XP_047979523.1 probable serine/threonine-protein kinase PBL19 [Salvia hispanica]XP_047979528.1 probable serine/threonine-protein kinase PBL19 [Salvia hispanica]XP_047979535.1 probable serine/threonine-protein kinase PBL19 [Salvia hispanica]